MSLAGARSRNAGTVCTDCIGLGWFGMVDRWHRATAPEPCNPLCNRQRRLMSGDLDAIIASGVFRRPRHDGREDRWLDTGRRDGGAQPDRAGGRHGGDRPAAGRGPSGSEAIVRARYPGGPAGFHHREGPPRPSRREGGAAAIVPSRSPHDPEVEPVLIPNLARWPVRRALAASLVALAVPAAATAQAPGPRPNPNRAGSRPGALSAAGDPGPAVPGHERPGAVRGGAAAARRRGQAVAEGDDAVADVGTDRRAGRSRRRRGRRHAGAGRRRRDLPPPRLPRPDRRPADPRAGRAVPGQTATRRSGRS